MANKMSEKNKSASQSEIEEPKRKELRGGRSSATRDGRASKPVKRDVKAATATASSKKPRGFRNWPAVRFTREAYHELRYKVTWPTFLEARNMTLVVIVLSAVVGIVLGVVDQGLFQLFKLVTGK